GPCRLAHMLLSPAGGPAMSIRRPILCGLLLSAAAVQPALAETTDVSGRWTGKTMCPGGAVSFTIDVDGTTGTFSHGGFGPDKDFPASHPITIRHMEGWEGEWVYFVNSSSSPHASFNGLN